MEKITERSLYPDLQNLLVGLGFDSVTEVEVKVRDTLFPDIIFKSKKGEVFVLQVKVGEQKGMEGVVDAYKHARALNTDYR